MEFTPPETAKIRIQLNGEFDAKELQDIIADLMQARAGMESEVPRTLPDMPSVPEIAVEGSPLFKVRTLTTGGLRIWLRHAGFGWIGFTLQPADVDGLREFLSKRLGHSQIPH
jgi:hypothetical protein